MHEQRYLLQLAGVHVIKDEALAQSIRQELEGQACVSKKRVWGPDEQLSAVTLRASCDFGTTTCL